MEQYLRAFTSDKPHRWVEWLSFAKYWFNSNFHTALKLTPFETLYGFPPPRSHTYVPGTTRVEALDSILQQRQEVLASLGCNLAATQDSMKVQANNHQKDRSF